MVVLDGSMGEGGGQVLRTALSLSVATGREFRITGIRARRPKPGLRQQHVTAVEAAARIGRAEVAGAILGSQELVFRPGKVAPGIYRFSVGTAGSVGLVLQAVLPPLLTAPGDSSLALEGGTHNPFAPPFEFLEKAYFPLLNRLGPTVSATLERPGFYPAGGGTMSASVRPCPHLSRLELMERGRTVAVRARALVANLPRHIAERELRKVAEVLRVPLESAQVEEVRGSPGPGNAVVVEVESQHVTEVFTGFGAKGVPAEAVAEATSREALQYLDGGAPVGEHLADQLLVPLALGAGGCFATVKPTSHTETNAEVLRRFLEVPVSLTQEGLGLWVVAVGGVLQ